jgi:hypothetical protein
MTVVLVMQMTVVQIVGVIVVFDGGMAATGAVGMIVMIVDFASHFDSSLSAVEFKPFRLRPYIILFWHLSKQFLLY